MHCSIQCRRQRLIWQLDRSLQCTGMCVCVLAAGSLSHFMPCFYFWQIMPRLCRHPAHPHPLSHSLQGSHISEQTQRAR